MKSLDEIRDEIISVDKLPSHEDAARFWSYLMAEGEEWVFCIDNGIFQLWNEEYITELADLLKSFNEKPMIEIFAGSGKLSYYLRKKGVDIIATDNYSLDTITRDTALVEKLDYKKALEKYNPSLVLASWILDESRAGIDALMYPSVKNLVMIGEIRGGMCGTDEIYKIAESKIIDAVDKYNVSRSVCSETRVFSLR